MSERVFGCIVNQMLGTTDLTEPHEVEQLRRSIAMLNTGAPAFNREDALTVLVALGRQLEAAVDPDS